MEMLENIEQLIIQTVSEVVIEIDPSMQELLGLL